jgi:hypothetical protein
LIPERFDSLGAIVHGENHLLHWMRCSRSWITLSSRNTIRRQRGHISPIIPG